MKMKPGPTNLEENPLFTWTANCITTWSNRRAEDMLIVINNAPQFAVVIYQVKRKDLKNIEDIIQNAIRNTFAAMNINEKIIDQYMEQAGQIEFVKNSDRKATAWLNRAAQDITPYIANKFNGIDKMYNDTLGVFLNDRPVNFGKKLKNVYYPDKKMVDALSEMSGSSVYNYKAYELLVTLDLYAYKATRKIIVPANITFHQMHRVLQRIFDWENMHLFDFAVFGEDPYKPAVRLVPFEDDLDYDSNATLMGEHVLSEYLPKYKEIIYRYDFGDNWVHEIELIRVIDEHDAESPYLLEAEGKSPPEDVGGVGGFKPFLKVLEDPKHPDYQAMRKWSGYWKAELRDWDKKPKVIKM